MDQWSYACDIWHTHSSQIYMYTLYMKILFICHKLNTWQLSETLEVIPDGSVGVRERQSKEQQPHIGQNGEK